MNLPGPDQQVNLLRQAVVPLARRYKRMSFDDAIQDGWFGLHAAARSFNPSVGVPFEAYAIRRIRSAVFDAMRLRDGARRKDFDARSERESLDSPLNRAAESRVTIRRCVREDARLGAVDDADACQAVLRWLPAEQRAMARMYLLDGMLIREIAAATGNSESLVQFRLAKIRRALLPNWAA